MKDEERITNHPDGYSVKNDWDKIDKILCILDSEMSKHNFMQVDCLTALCILAIETAYNGKITKPQFLTKISQWWEEMDNQANE